MVSARRPLRASELVRRDAASDRLPHSTLLTMAALLDRCPYTQAAQREFLEGRCDNVVDTFFTWSQRVVTGTWFGPDNPNVIGAGHAKPRVDEGKRSLDPTFTHWVDLNVGTSPRRPGAPARATTYAESRSPAPSCFVEPSFLYCARERGPNWGRPFKACGGRQGPFTKAWNFGGVRDPNTLGRIVDDRSDGIRQANVQLASGAFRGDRATVAPISPAWGIRSGQSAVRLHGGIASAPILCLFNKLLFDDASRRPSRGGDQPGSVEVRYWLNHRQRVDTTAVDHALR